MSGSNVVRRVLGGIVLLVALSIALAATAFRARATQDKNQSFQTFTNEMAADQIDHGLEVELINKASAVIQSDSQLLEDSKKYLNCGDRSINTCLFEEAKVYPANESGAATYVQWNDERVECSVHIYFDANRNLIPSPNIVPSAWHCHFDSQSN